MAKVTYVVLYRSLCHLVKQSRMKAGVSQALLFDLTHLLLQSISCCVAFKSRCVTVKLCVGLLGILGERCG